MAWQPKPAGPRTPREFFHWAWRELKSLGGLVGDVPPEGGYPDPPVTPSPPQPPAQHSHYLDNLINVKITGPELNESLVFDPSDTGFWVNGEARHQLSESNPTGLIQGGELNIGPGANDIEVIAGLGVIVDSYTAPDERPVVQGIEWPQINEAITAAPSVAGSTVHFTIYDTGIASTPVNGRPVNLGALRQYATPPGEPVRRDEIYLGVAVHNGDSWGEISSPIVINNSAHTLSEYLKRVAGPTFVIDGGVVEENAGFTIGQTAGTVWEHNRNWHVDKKDPHREGLLANPSLSWKYVNRDFTDVSAATTVVDPTQWDDGGVVSPVPNPGNTATIQKLYQDPRDNYWILWGQQVFDNATEAAASIDAPTELPPILQASVLLGYIVVEKQQTDWDIDEAFIVYPEGGGGAGGGGIPITKFIDLADTPGAYAGTRRQVTATQEAEAALEFDYRTKGVQYVNGAEYHPQELVFQDGWLMMANKITTDYPAPQPVGDPVYSLPDEPVFTTYQDTSVIYSGHLYTFTAPGYFRALRVWVPELTGTTNYRIVAIRNPNSANPIYTYINDPVLRENEWITLVSDTILVLAGEELLVYIDALNSGSNISPGGTPTDWFMQTSNNTTLPSPGFWNTNVQQTLLRINEDDADANPPIDFSGVISGSTFKFTDINDPNVSITYLATTGETYDAVNGVYSWTVAIDSIGTNGQPSAGDRTLGEIEVPVAASTKFVGIDSYWGPGTTPTWAGVVSYLQFNGVPQAVTGDEAYGIDIAFQELIASPDWDFFGLPSSGGGGGGGGLEEHTLSYHSDVTITTPADGQTLRYEADTGQWENTGALIVDDGGAVGVGISSPLGSLHVKAPDTLGVPLVLQTTNNAGDRCNIDFLTTAAPTNGQTRIGGVASDLYFRVGNQERMRITSAGNVGIGTSSPSNKLHVTSSGAPARFIQTSSACSIYIEDNGTTAFTNYIGSAGDAVRIGTSGSERMRITSAGGVLVGLTTGGQGAGTINVSGGYYVNGTPQAAITQADYDDKVAKIATLEAQVAALTAAAITAGWTL